MGVQTGSNKNAPKGNQASNEVSSGLEKRAQNIPLNTAVHHLKHSLHFHSSLPNLFFFLKQDISTVKLFWL